MPFAGLISWFGLTLFNREQRSEVFSRKHTIKGKLNRLQGTKLLFNHRSRRIRFNRGQRSKVFSRKETIEVTSGL